MGDEIEDWKPPTPAIPNGWVAVDFEYVFENISVNGKKIKQKEYLEEGILPVIDQGAQLIGGYTNKSQSKIKLEKPVIVFGDHTRCFKHINFDFAPGADGVKILLPQEGFDSTFLYYLCKILKLPNRGYSRHYSFLKKSILPIAPFNEQKRIVDTIERLFSALDEGEALLKTVQKQLATYRQSVLKAAVTGDLTKDWREKNKKKLESGEKLLARILETRRKNWKGRGKYQEPEAPDVSKLPELPFGWGWFYLDALIAEIITGPFGSSLHKSDYINGGMPLINPINIKQQKVIPDLDVTVSKKTLARLERFKVREGDVIVGRRGEMGRCAPITSIESGWLCGTGSLILRPISTVTAQYLSTFISSAQTVNYLEKNCVGTTMKNLNQDVLNSIVIALPCVEEQVEILERMSEVFSQIDIFESLCTAELKRSATLRQSILKSAFSGKLVAQDPADEPASELLARIKSGGKYETKPKAKATTSRRGHKSRSGKKGVA